VAPWPPASSRPFTVMVVPATMMSGREPITFSFVVDMPPMPIVNECTAITA
jgi:hypothetical protein